MKGKKSSERQITKRRQHQTVQPQIGRITQKKGRMGGNTDQNITKTPVASNAAEKVTTSQPVTPPQQSTPLSKDKDKLKVKRFTYNPPCVAKILQNDLSFNGTIPKYRLRNGLNFWKSIKANKTVLEIISAGYRIPFLKLPPKMFLLQ